MKFRLLGTAIAVFLCLGFVPFAHGYTIDSFTVGHELTGSLPGGSPARSTVLGGMLGGSREMSVGGTLPEAAVTAKIEAGSLTITRAEAGQHFIDLIWRPLGFDLTQGGTKTAFLIDVGMFTNTTTIILSVVSRHSDPAGNRFFHTLQSAGPLEASFDDFAPFSGGAAVDFTNIDSLALRVHTTGVATLNGGLVLVPEPGTGLLLLSGLTALATSKRRRSVNGYT